MCVIDDKLIAFLLLSSALFFLLASGKPAHVCFQFGELLLKAQEKGKGKGKEKGKGEDGLLYYCMCGTLSVFCKWGIPLLGEFRHHYHTK